MNPHNAFTMHRTEATRHEKTIAAAMLEHERKRPKLADMYRDSKPRKDPHADMWADRGARIKAIIADNPGCYNVTIRNALGEPNSVVSTWMTKMRVDGKKHGIRHILDDKSKQYRYWLIDQSFIEKETK